jgi:hypothetical protein
VFRRLRFDTEEGDGPLGNDHNEGSFQLPRRGVFLERARTYSVECATVATRQER